MPTSTQRKGFTPRQIITTFLGEKLGSQLGAVIFRPSDKCKASSHPICQLRALLEHCTNQLPVKL